MAAGTTVPASAQALLVGDPPADAPELHVLRRARPFPEDSDGGFARELPEQAMVKQLEWLRRGGAAYLVLPVTAFGWLAERPDLRRHIEQRYHLLVQDDACRVFDLRPSAIGSFLDALLPEDEPVVAVVRQGAVLDLAARPVRHVEAASLGGADIRTQIDTWREEELRIVVVPDMMPWGPADDDVVQAIDRHLVRLAVRPGLCDVYDIAAGQVAGRAGGPPWRRFVRGLFSND